MTKLSCMVATATITLAALVSFEASADATYEFDSISGIVLGDTIGSSITGIVRNSSTPITVPFTGTTTDRINRCVPVFLTMLEKPGRYYLTLATQSPSGPNGEQLKNCGLTLRN